MNNLHLVLKGQWYDMIESGVKREEYRDIKDYWVKRLVWRFDEMERIEFNSLVSDLKNPTIRHNSIRELEEYYSCELAYFPKIIFQHGYSKDSRRMTFECKGIEIREGNTEWGAVPGVKYFVIKLGERL